MKKGIFCLVAVLMFAMGVPGEAALNGATGLLNIPTAGVVSEGHMDLSYNHYDGNAYAALTLGIFPGVEAGVLANPVGSPSLAGNLKVNLTDESQNMPAIAVGLSVRNPVASYYAVASKQIAVPGLRGHIGLGTGSYSSGFAGISKVLNPVTVASNSRSFTVPVTTAIVEYDGSGMNTGLLFDFSSALQGRVFVSDLETFGIGVRYRVRF